MQEQEKRDSYIDKISFNPGDFGKIIKGYFSNIRFSLMLIIILISAGAVSYTTIPRTLNPEVKISIVVVSTALPGAGPEDVESLVTIPLEDKILNVSGIDVSTSSSREGFSSIVIQFISDVDPDKAKQDVQSAVDSITDLPDDATTPKVEKLDFENQPIWTFSITSQSDEASLNRFSNQLKDKLEELPKIDKVTVNGLEDQEIQVLVKDEAITQYGINPITLLPLIQTEVSSHPAGSVNTRENSLALTIDSQVTSLEDIRDINIVFSGQRYKLSDIAFITQRSKSDQFGAFLARPDSSEERAVSFSVFKNSETKINEAQADAEALLEKELFQQGGKFKLVNVYSIAKELETQFNDLFSSFRNTILLVFLVLFIFFGIRQAIIASLTIPMTFLAAMVVMDITGISLNFLSAFSLLLSLGLLVDVTIVIISAVTSFYRSGKFSPYEAGLLTWKDYFVALWATTLTTVWAFIPLLLASGIIGEFIKPIPIVVSSTLISATLIGLFVTLPFMIFILKPSVPRRVKILLWSLIGIMGGALIFFLTKGSAVLPIIILIYIIFILFSYGLRFRLAQSFRNSISQRKLIRWISQRAGNVVDEGLFSMQKVSVHYKRVLSKILASKKARRKTIVMVIIFSLFAFSLLPMGFVVSEFFPKEDTNEIYVDIEFPEGTKKAVVQEESLQVLDELKDTEFAATTLLRIGVGYSAESGPGGISGSNRSLFAINLIPKEDRKKTSIKISEDIQRKYQNYSKGKISVNLLSGGPPAGSEVQIKYSGEDLEKLGILADKTINYLQSQPGVVNVDKSIKAGTAKIVFIPNKAKLAEMGLTLSDVGMAMRTFASGLELDKDVTLKEGGTDKYDIIFRTSEKIQEAESLGRINIASRSGQVPLLMLGDLRLDSNPTIITREDGKRSISVTAGVAEGYSANVINANLGKYADSELNLPSGYTWKTGGANEENEKSVQSILQAMVLSFMLILATMVIQFGSFRKALLVLLVIPLAVSGVFIIFALAGIPLSFPALIGVLALFGIVVNNSIILIDKIRLNIGVGMELNEALAEASSSRLEPIVLSSLTTIVGLIPVTLSSPLWQGLGGAIIAGLMFSGSIMLFFIPVVYRAWFAREE